MNKEICRKCKASHCVLLMKRKSKCAYIKSDDDNPISFNPAELFGTTHIIEKYGTAFRYRFNDGGDIEKGVVWEFDDYVPSDKCDCECYAEQMVDSLNRNASHCV